MNILERVKGRLTDTQGFNVTVTVTVMTWASSGMQTVFMTDAVRGPRAK